MTEDYFKLGKFWQFVIASFFAMASACSTYIISYYAVVGYSTITSLQDDLPQSVMLTNQMHSLLSFIAITFIFACVIIFAGWHVSTLLQKLEIPIWISNATRLSSAVTITVISCVSVVNLGYIFNMCFVGEEFLRRSATGSWYAIICTNLTETVPVLAYGVIFCYIFGVWMLLVGYLINPELMWIDNKLICLLKWAYHKLKGVFV